MRFKHKSYYFSHMTNFPDEKQLTMKFLIRDRIFRFNIFIYKTRKIFPSIYSTCNSTLIRPYHTDIKFVAKNNQQYFQ